MRIDHLEKLFFRRRDIDHKGGPTNAHDSPTSPWSMTGPERQGLSDLREDHLEPKGRFGHLDQFSSKDWGRDKVIGTARRLLREEWPNRLRGRRSAVSPRMVS